MKMTKQEQTDAYRKAQFIVKHRDIWERCPIYRTMICSTVYFTPEEIHESMLVVGWKYIPPNPESRVWDDEPEDCSI